MENYQMLFAGFIVANMVALNFKIVWDWLQNRRGGIQEGKPVEKKHCEDHASCNTRIGACEKCLSKIKQEQARFDERDTGIIQRLDAGAENFKDLRSEMSVIAGDVKAIVAVIQDRSQGGGPLFQR